MDAFKRGWKTTEFWMTLAANAVGMLGIAGQLPLPANLKGGAQVAGGVITAVATAAYSISRAVTKQAATPVVPVAAVPVAPLSGVR